MKSNKLTPAFLAAPIHTLIPGLIVVRTMIEIRKAKELTVPECCKRACPTINVSTWTGWETGSHGVSLNMLPAVAKALDVHVTTLVANLDDADFDEEDED